VQNWFSRSNRINKNKYLDNPKKSYKNKTIKRKDKKNKMENKKKKKK
jgi:hypothetical protein